MYYELSDIKSYIRDVNLELLTQDLPFVINTKRRYNNLFHFKMPNAKLVNYVTEIGGVLTGSKALRCYNHNRIYLLDRKSHDWDFIITVDMAFKIFEKFKINIIPKSGELSSIQKQRYWRHPDYGEAYRVGPVDVHLFICDELPAYNEISNIRFSTVSQIVNSKVRTLEDLYELRDSTTTSNYINENIHKHLTDLRQTIIKFYVLNENFRRKTSI
jgi:hypothetical protein